jgi:hypothetical protein
VKIKPTKKDIDYIKNMQARSLMERWMRWKDSLNFNEGDILVKEVERGYPDKKWEVEKASTRSSHPAKYVFLHKDDNGMGYIKKLSSTGEATIGHPMSLYDMDLDRVRFKVCADFQDAILLGAEDGYDPAKNYLEEKKLRAQIREYNMKQMMKFKTQDEVVKWLQDNFSKTIWIGNDRTGDHFEEWQIGALHEKRSWDTGYKIVDLIDPAAPKKQPREMDVRTLYGQRIIFHTRPKSVKDQV